MRICDWSSDVCSSDLLDAAGPADARQIVAQEIYDHEVLGAILGAFGQFARIAPVTGRIGAPRPGALHRPYVDPPVGAREEKFGRWDASRVGKECCIRGSSLGSPIL